MKSCIILCGGRSRRMGQDKGLMTLNGKPLIIHMLETIDGLVDEIILVLRDEAQLDLFKKCINEYTLLLKNQKKIIHLVTDLETDQGPLIGLITGLSQIKSEGALLLPCDSPFITPFFIREIFKIKDKKKNTEDDYLAIVPKWPDGSVEPLHSYYRKECISPIDKLLKNGFNDVKSLFKIINVDYIDINVLDPGKTSFKNLNRPEDLP